MTFALWRDQRPHKIGIYWIQTECGSYIQNKISIENWINLLQTNQFPRLLLAVLIPLLFQTVMPRSWLWMGWMNQILISTYREPICQGTGMPYMGVIAFCFCFSTEEVNLLSAWTPRNISWCNRKEGFLSKNGLWGIASVQKSLKGNFIMKASGLSPLFPISFE